MNRTYSETYLLNNQNQYSPINLVPVAGVRCIQCGLIINPNVFPQHSRMHLTSHHHFKTQISHPNKTNIFSILSEKQNVEQLAVKSFLPDQLPAKEQLRKSAGKKNPLSLSIMNDYVGPELNSVKIDEIQHTDTFDESWVDKQYQESIKITKKIILQKQRFKIHKKHPNYYKNQKSQVELLDKFSLSAKTRKQQTREQSESGYQIDKIKKYDINYKPVTIKVNTGRKNSKNVSKVGTISTKSTFFSLNQNNSIHFDKDEDKEKQKNHLQCRGCKGFYCYECGSDIPPQYRQPTSRFQVDDEVQDFYKKHIHLNKKLKSECGTCQEVIQE